ncbi:ferrous iron transporter B [Planctomycetes bacterium K23_9]|uniref:Ferrous iron transport protein B n=1 Tax=Stieleria marina TaxID=1930275 RepID=A0A517NMX0_9BACT|nr:Ferrous iron transport protein B [Planctomycetes bacterium K23_9]
MSPAAPHSAAPQACAPTTDIVLLAGNPNTGKTSLFNALSGMRAKTANYPGITVDLRKVTMPIASPDQSQPPTFIDLIDLPGLYSLEPTSPEETVSSEALQGRRLGTPAAVVLVLDATNLSRNLLLANEVLQLGLPTLAVLNMIDSAESSGIEIDQEKLSKQMECPVVAVSARTGFGLDKFHRELDALLAKNRATPALPIARPSCSVGCTGCRYAATFDWSESVVAQSVSGNREPRNENYEWIDRILTAPLVGTLSLLAIMLSVFFLIFSLADIPMSAIESGFGWISDRVDGIIPTETVHKALWIPLITAIGMATFAMGYRLAEIRWGKRAIGVAVVTSLLIALLPLEDFRSLILHGVIGGIAGVVVFLPQICILFFFITILEDSGYMARAAFVMERIMRRVGLPGKAFVPMLSAHACAIPGIMATRTIENWRDRLVTILVLPLLTCSARLPVYAMISALLFGANPLLAALTFAGAYMLGLGAALLSAWCLKKTIIAGEAAPLVIELPPYRMPTLRNAFFTTLDRASVFLRNAGSIILLISVILWAMATYPKLPESAVAQQNDSAELDSGSLAQQSLEYSIAGRTGKALEPIFSPLGFDWKINVGVVSSFAAREVLVSTLSIVYGMGEEGADDEAGLVEKLRRQKRADGSPVFTTAVCFSVLVFYVLAMQCLPTQAITKRETGSWKWAIFQLVYMTVMAYVAAMITFQSLAALGFNA